MRILIFFIFFFSNAFSDEIPDIKNLVVNKEPKTYDNLSFLNTQKEKVYLNSFKGKLVMINFWASWCAPCKEEMPSLDTLQKNLSLDNLKIFPINIGQDNIENSKNFFIDLNIKNLEIYFDNPDTLAKTFSLRGIPTTILFNKKGEEFARVIGSINFNDSKFIDWLESYN
tara:strand:- start:67 stop:576 length:510 start_codon:yes stop_codon:yes gene_type:complete